MWKEVIPMHSTLSPWRWMALIPLLALVVVMFFAWN